MISEEKALNIITDKFSKPYSCTILKNFYVFNMHKDETVFYAVDKEHGNVYPFSPGLCLLEFNNAEKHIY